MPRTKGTSVKISSNKLEQVNEFKYSRNLLSCKCYNGNCVRYNSKLCDPLYRDEIGEQDNTEIKKLWSSTRYVLYENGKRIYKDD